MRKSKTTIIILLLISFSGFVIYKSQIVNLHKTNINITKNKAVQETQTNQNQKENTAILNEPNEDLNKSPSVTTFDDDPVVDKEIIAQKYKHCSTLLKRLKNNAKNNYGYSKLQKKRPDYYKKQLTFCQKINTEHPEYNLEKKISNKSSSNSYLGRIYSDEEFAFSEIENNSESVQRAFINANPNLMFSFYAKMGYISFIPDLRLILESQQNDYGLIIGKYAQILFACRLGADCGQNSAIVFNTCLHNQDLCANNIEELIKTKFSQGQQADIELAVQHLYSVYYPDK